MKLTGAQIIIEELCKHNIKTVFGYPGGTVLPLYDELYKNSHRINHIITAHEQGAIHAADGYARVSREAGVVIATSGPGATNLITGIANAYLDSVPLVAITGNVAVALLGKETFQEVDIVGITTPIVKHNFLVRDIIDLEDVLREAFFIATSGRPGPVLVDIPKDVQTNLCEYNDTPVIVEEENIEKFYLEDVFAEIKASKRPYIYAGGGVIASGASEELLEFSKRISAPIGLSMMGITAVPSTYELNLGMCGMHGKFVSTMVKSESDLIIALGVRFSDRATGDVKEYVKGHKIIHVDIDNVEMCKNIESAINIQGDIKQFLTQLLKHLPESRNEEWLDDIEKYKRMNEPPTNDEFTPKNIIEMVARNSKDSTVVATDVGQHQMWVTLFYDFMKPQTLLTSGGLGTMGYGMGAAIGGCIANNLERTILFTSDGSFGMNLNELATAVTQEIPLVVVILNNGVLGLVRQWQKMFYGQRYSQTTLKRKTNFELLAKAFGANGFTVKTLQELESVLTNLDENSPTVIDCHIDLDEMVFPMIPPCGSIKNILVR